MDIVTLGAALNGSAEYVNSHFKGGSNIQIVDNPDGTQTINASGEVSSEDAVARAEIAAIKDGETLDSFGDVETALDDKANTSTTYTKTEVDTALGNKADKSTTYTKAEVDTALSAKQNTISDLATIRSGAALGATAVQPETGKGLSTNDYTTAEKTKLAGIAEGAEVNVQSNWTQTTTTADDYIKNKPTLGTAAAKNATDTYNATGTDVTTGKAVAAALATLPEPMVFKGSLGTGGTITTLPTASSSNKGYVYKVITTGTYASQSAKVGDTFISDGSAWVLIPSGDEPSGTVTNVAVSNGGGLTVSGSPITSSGTITVGHSNSVTAKTSSSVKKITYDAYGHITGSSELSTAESNALASGIDSTKVAQIATNETNIGKVQTDNDDNFNRSGYKNLSTVYTGTGAAGSFIVPDTPITLPAGDYVVTFKSTATSANGSINFKDGSSIVQTINFANSSVVTKEITITSSTITTFNIYSNAATTYSDVMICTVSDYTKSQTFVKHALSNTKITPELIELVDSGAKNILDYTVASGSITGLSWTVNSDKSITVQVTGTHAKKDIVLKTFANGVGNNMVLSGCPSGGNLSTGFALYAANGTTAAVIATDTGNGMSLSYNSIMFVSIVINADVPNGTYTFKPMICTKAAWDVSQKFVPYRPTYEETVEQVAENKNNISLLQAAVGYANTELEGVL